MEEENESGIRIGLGYQHRQTGMFFRRQLEEAYAAIASKNRCLIFGEEHDALK